MPSPIRLRRRFTVHLSPPILLRPGSNVHRQALREFRFTSVMLHYDHNACIFLLIRSLFPYPESPMRFKPLQLFRNGQLETQLLHLTTLYHQQDPLSSSTASAIQQYRTPVSCPFPLAALSHRCVQPGMLCFMKRLNYTISHPKNQRIVQHRQDCKLSIPNECFTLSSVQP